MFISSRTCGAEGAVGMSARRVGRVEAHHVGRRVVRKDALARLGRLRVHEHARAHLLAVDPRHCPTGGDLFRGWPWRAAGRLGGARVGGDVALLRTVVVSS